nr:hypothetical protein [Tanacetum cinerariifolium]
MLSIFRSINPIDNSSSNSSFDNSISNSYSNLIDVVAANINDRPKIWIPDVESNLKPSKGHVLKKYHSTEVPDIKYFNCTRGGKIKDSKYENYKFDTSVFNRDKGKGKAIDDGSSGKGKKIDVSKVSESAIKNSFRKNTSCKTGFLARVMVRKIDNDMFEEMYGGFENIGVVVVDFKNFRHDMNLFIRDRDAQMAMEKLDNLEKLCDGFFMDYCQGEGDSLCGLFWANKVARLNYKCVGLLSDEIVNSYIWLFQALKKAFVADPQVVVNDQDVLMKQAVELEFPNARHRLCVTPPKLG